MNAFSAESNAWKYKASGQDIVSEAVGLINAIKRGEAGREEIKERLRVALKTLAKAETALRDIDDALDVPQPMETR